jgi:hypothetical protein
MELVAFGRGAGDRAVRGLHRSGRSEAGQARESRDGSASRSLGDGAAGDDLAVGVVDGEDFAMRRAGGAALEEPAGAPAALHVNLADGLGPAHAHALRPALGDAACGCCIALGPAQRKRGAERRHAVGFAMLAEEAHGRRFLAGGERLPAAGGARHATRGQGSAAARGPKRVGALLESVWLRRCAPPEVLLHAPVRAARGLPRFGFDGYRPRSVRVARHLRASRPVMRCRVLQDTTRRRARLASLDGKLERRRERALVSTLSGS